MMILIGICFLSLVLLSVPGFHVAGDVTVSTLSSQADTTQGWSSEHQFGMLSFVALGRLWGDWMSSTEVFARFSSLHVQ